MRLESEERKGKGHEKGCVEEGVGMGRKVNRISKDKGDDFIDFLIP